MKKSVKNLHRAAQWAIKNATSFLVGGVVVLTMSSAYSTDISTTITMPHTFSNNTVADATQVNANFTTLKNEIIVNRNAINNMHLAVMANGQEVGKVASFSPFTLATAISGVTTQGYNFRVTESGAIVNTVTDADLQVQNINTSSTCSGSSQSLLLVGVPLALSQNTIFRFNLTSTPTGSDTNTNLWCGHYGYYSCTNPWNSGSYVYSSSTATVSTVRHYVIDSYSNCNVSQTFTGPFFQPINYVHSLYNAPDITGLGLTPNVQGTTGVPSNGFTGPVTISVQH